MNKDPTLFQQKPPPLCHSLFEDSQKLSKEEAEKE